MQGLRQSHCFTYIVPIMGQLDCRAHAIWIYTMTGGYAIRSLNGSHVNRSQAYYKAALVQLL
jgi:hypothetical protein